MSDQDSNTISFTGTILLAVATVALLLAGGEFFCAYQQKIYNAGYQAGVDDAHKMHRRRR